MPFSAFNINHAAPPQSLAFIHHVQPADLHLIGWRAGQRSWCILPATVAPVLKGSSPVWPKHGSSLVLAWTYGSTRLDETRGCILLLV